MNCEECIHNKHHLPGSRYAVAEGHDDPYEYWYCAMGYWDSEVEFSDEEWSGEEGCKDLTYPREAHERESD